MDIKEIKNAYYVNVKEIKNLNIDFGKLRC